MTDVETVSGAAVSKPGKELFPETAGSPAVTKLDLARYYAGVAPMMLPYLWGRPVNMQRSPTVDHFRIPTTHHSWPRDQA